MEYGLGEAKEGMPLGGLGTGFITIGTDGSFQEIVTMGNPRAPILRPEHSFLAILVSTSRHKVVKVLENPAPFGLPAIKYLKYSGLFPFITIHYIDEEIPLDLHLKAFSPFISGDPRCSGLPVILFKLTARSRVSESLTAALLFSWGYSLGSRVFKEDNIKGTVLYVDQGNYTIASIMREGVEVEISSPWSSSSIKTFWDIFVKDCSLRRFKGSSKDPVARALVQRFTLPPLGERDVIFALSWFFPNLRDSEGKFIGRMYANWFKNSKEVMLYSLRNFNTLYERTSTLHSKIRVFKLPQWLEDALLNSLYSLVKNTLWIKDGKFAHSESFTGCPITETIVCRFNGSLPILLLFPEIELKVMQYFASLQREDGAIPFAFGRPELFDKPYYETQKSLNSSEFVLMVYRDYLFTRSKKFLDNIYPNVKRAVRYAQSLDTDGDYLVNEVSMQYYDQWRFYGTSAYVAGIWLAALRAAEEMARLSGDRKFATECNMWFKIGRVNYEHKLWNGIYYRLYSEPETGKISEVCLCNQLMGQLYAYLLGLGDILPREHIVSALHAVFHLNVRATKFGAVSGVRPEGAPEPGPHSEVVIFGEVMNYAATCLYTGLLKEGLEVAKRAYENVVRYQRSPWNIYFSYDSETGEPIWGSNYYSNMCIWHLLPAWLRVDIGELRDYWSIPLQQNTIFRTIK